MYYNRIGNDNMWFFQAEETEILEFRIQELMYPEDMSIQAWGLEIQKDYNLFAWSDPSYKHETDWELPEGTGWPMELEEFQKMEQDTQDFISKMKESKHNISNLLGNFTPKVVDMHKQQHENKTDGEVWIDYLSNGTEGNLARLCIGQEGLDGWTGIALMDDTFNMTILTPMGLITEPALELWKAPLELLQEFIGRNFNVIK